MNEQIDIDRISINDNVQQRVQLDEKVIFEYTELIEDGGQFPPLTVFDDGEKLILADGRHRYEAYKLAGKDVVAAEILSGKERDAILHAVGANAKHGLRRTNADKRYAAETMLKDEEWGTWSDGEIARKVRVSQAFVSKIRRELTQNGFEFNSKRMGKDGRMLETSNIGSRNTDSNSGQGDSGEESPVDDNHGEEGPPEDNENSLGVQRENDSASETDGDGSDEKAQNGFEEREKKDSDVTSTKNQEDEHEESGSEGDDKDVTSIENQDESAEEIDNEEEDSSSDTEGEEDSHLEDEGRGSVESQQTGHAFSADGTEEEAEGLDDEFAEEDSGTGESPLIDDPDALRSRISELQVALNQRDEQLRLKDERITELERQVKDLSDGIKYYEAEIVKSTQESLDQGSGSAQHKKYEPALYL